MIVLIASKANVAPWVSSERPFIVPRKVEVLLTGPLNIVLSFRQNYDKEQCTAALINATHGGIGLAATAALSFLAEHNSRCCRILGQLYEKIRRKNEARHK